MTLQSINNNATNYSTYFYIFLSYFKSFYNVKQFESEISSDF